MHGPRIFVDDASILSTDDCEDTTVQPGHPNNISIQNPESVDLPDGFQTAPPTSPSQLVDNAVSEEVAAIKIPEHLLTTTFVEAIPDFRHPDTLFTENYDEVNSTLRLVGVLNRIAYVGYQSNYVYNTPQRLTYVDANLFDSRMGYVYDNSPSVRKTKDANPVQITCLITMERVSNYVVETGDILTFDDDKLAQGKIPVIVNGAIAGVVSRCPTDDLKWMLELWYSTRMGTYGGSIKYSTPITQWDKADIIDTMQIVEQIITRFVHFSFANVVTATDVLVNEIYRDDILALANFYNITQHFNINELRRNQIGARLTTYQDSFHDMQNEIMSLASKISANNSLLYNLRLHGENEADIITNETINNPRIKHWYARDDKLHFWTDDIYMKPDFYSSEFDDYFVEHSGINIGSYEIVVNMTNIDAGSTAILLFSMDGGTSGYESGMQAPHVFSTGSPCFGTYIDAVSDAYAANDIPTLLDVLILFLSSATANDSAGKYWPRWIDE